MSDLASHSLDKTIELFSEVEIERVREYWNSRPCNIRHSQKEIGTKEYFDEVEARKYFVEPHIPLFAQFEKWRGKRVLEIGCGIGTDTINFARAGALVTAVDVSDESLRIAKKRAEVFGLTDRITFYRANAETLSNTIPVFEYDLIYSFGVIHHTPHPENVIEQIKQYYAGSQTIIKIMVYNKISYKVFWLLLTEAKGKFWKLNNTIAQYSEAQTGCPVTYVYTKRTVQNLLRDFKINEIFVDHIFPYKISDYINYHYVKVWYFRILPKKLFRLLEKKFGWHLCATITMKNKEN
ncbi:MAG: methyltransferase domain-containing protein [Bacteroidetes bacterium]|nr:methyltransferase domain-containing protein [Bacteroidota bacterium]